MKVFQQNSFSNKVKDFWFLIGPSNVKVEFKYSSVPSCVVFVSGQTGNKNYF